MNGTPIFPALLSLLALVAFKAELAADPGEPESRPNILFIAVDDLRPEIFAYGAEHSVTPSMDKLAASGVLFSRAYCMVPTCGASRASLMTSVRPARNRFVSYKCFAEQDAPDAMPLHTHLKRNGYYTVSLGKVLHNKSDHADGWSEKPWGAGAPAYATEKAKKEMKPDSRGRLRGPPTEAGEVDDSFYADGKTADKAIQKLRELVGSGKEGRGPFFLAVGFLKPHLPFVAPKKYWDLYDSKVVRMPDNYHPPKGAPSVSIHNSGELRSYAGVPKKGLIPEPMALDLIHGYHACVSYTDAHIGRVLAELEDLGIAENTVVVLWGDHGWNLGEHTLWCKHSCYETSLHSPLIIRAPMIADSRGKAESLVEFIDIYPTLCDLASLPVPKHVEGKSLLPVLKDPDTAHKDAAISRFSSGDTIRTDQYRYTIYRNKGGEITDRMLYDHHRDPNENVNIVDDPELAPVVKELEARLLRDMGKPNKK